MCISWSTAIGSLGINCILAITLLCFLSFYQHGSILPHRTLLAILLCLSGYEHCCTQLLKLLIKCYNMDMFGFYLFTDISSLSLGHCSPLGSCVYSSQTPCCHATAYKCIYVCMYVCTYKCISCKNTFGVKKLRPSKVESYLEVNT